jgi:hypothetical protein
MATATRVAGNKEGKGGKAMAMATKVMSKRWGLGWRAKGNGDGGKGNHGSNKEGNGMEEGQRQRQRQQRGQWHGRWQWRESGKEWWRRQQGWQGNKEGEGGKGASQRDIGERTARNAAVAAAAAAGRWGRIFLFPHVFCDFFCWNSLGPIEILYGLGGYQNEWFSLIEQLTFQLNSFSQKLVPTQNWLGAFQRARS